MKDKMGSVLSAHPVPLRQGVVVVGVTADLTSRVNAVELARIGPKVLAARAAVPSRHGASGGDGYNQSGRCITAIEKRLWKA